MAHPKMGGLVKKNVSVRSLQIKKEDGAGFGGD